jgi:hypothetical protein
LKNISRECGSKTHRRCILEKKYKIDEARHARKVLHVNYYSEPASKEYLQKHKMAQNIKVPVDTPRKVKEEDNHHKKKTYIHGMISQGS